MPQIQTLPSGFVYKTKRLKIRFFQTRDFLAWRNAYLNLPKPRNRWDQKQRGPKELTRERFKKIVETGGERRAQGVYFDFIAFDSATGEIIGFVSLMDIARGVFQNAYLGYYLLNTHWGKGLAQEMTEAVITIGFKYLKLHRIEAGIELGNKRSEKLARRLGLRKEGVSKRRLYLNKKWRDMLVYALTSEERGYKHKGGELTGARR